MKPILDPRNGDIEDDAASTKRRSARGDQPSSLMVLLLVLMYLTSFIMTIVSHNIIGWMNEWISV
jgi:hypothetical protein